MEVKYNSHQELIESARKTYEAHAASFLKNAFPTIFSDQKSYPPTLSRRIKLRWYGFRFWLADLLECAAENIKPY